MKKIQIILPYIHGKGGTERAVSNLANMLVDNYYVEIISVYSNRNAKSFYYLSSNVRITNLGLEISNTFSNLKNSYFSLKKYVKATSPDYIIGTWYGVNILLPYISFTAKTIGCEHIDFNSISKLIQHIAKFTYPKLKAIVMLSETAKLKLNKNLNNCYIIPNSLPFITDKLSSQNEKKIITIGRLVEGKGYERLVPLAVNLQLNFPEWKIEICGDGPMYKKLKKIFKSNNLNNIYLAGLIKDVKEEYINSSIYVSTSYSEAFPMTFLEAMSCGLPIVSYQNEGAKSIISNNKDGFLVDDSEEFISKVTSLINSKEKRLEMADMAVQKSNQYKSEVIKEKWINLLKAI